MNADFIFGFTVGNQEYAMNHKVLHPCQTITKQYINDWTRTTAPKMMETRRTPGKHINYFWSLNLKYPD